MWMQTRLPRGSAPLAIWTLGPPDKLQPPFLSYCPRLLYGRASYVSEKGWGWQRRESRSDHFACWDFLSLGGTPEGWQSSRLDKSPDLGGKNHSQNLFSSFVKWDNASLLTVTSGQLRLRYNTAHESSTLTKMLYRLQGLLILVNSVPHSAYMTDLEAFSTCLGLSY